MYQNSHKAIYSEPLYKWKFYDEVSNKFIIKYKFEAVTKIFENHQIEAESLKYVINYINYATEPNLKQREQFIKASILWENVSNLKFIEDNISPDLYVSGSQMNIMPFISNEIISGASIATNDLNENFTIFIDNDVSQKIDLALFTFLHEIGHVVGLKDSSWGDIILPFELDNNSNTIMSYVQVNNAYPVSPMILDIRAISEIYGKNLDFHSTNDCYHFEQGQEGISTIFDTGGIDLIDTSQIKDDVNINLNPGLEHVSYYGLNNKYFYIYDETEIENVKTGSGNDVIIGNMLNNDINAGSGSNIITGGGGDDRFIFIKGNKGHNIITDFNKDQDKIVIVGIFNNSIEAMNKVAFYENYAVLYLEELYEVKLLMVTSIFEYNFLTIVN